MPLKMWQQLHISCIPYCVYKDEIYFVIIAYITEIRLVNWITSLIIILTVYSCSFFAIALC